MSPQAVTASTIKQQRARRKKKMRKYGLITGGGLIFFYLVYLLFVPYKGEMTYGVCKTFLELNVPYPDHVRLNSVDDMGAVVRIWYTQIDSFGEYRMESMTCTYRGATDADTAKYGGKMPFVLDKVSIGRRDVDAFAVEQFNYAIPTVIAMKPDLVLPSPLPNNLQDLQTTSNKFRKPLF